MSSFVHIRRKLIRRWLLSNLVNDWNSTGLSIPPASICVAEMTNLMLCGNQSGAALWREFKERIQNNLFKTTNPLYISSLDPRSLNSQHTHPEVLPSQGSSNPCVNMKALLRLSFAVSLFYSVALGANFPDLPPEIRRDIVERVTAYRSATLRLTSKEHWEMFPHPPSPIEIMLAVCDTDRFLHCQRKVNELLDEPTQERKRKRKRESANRQAVHEGIPPVETKRMSLIRRAIQEDVPWAAVALLQGRMYEYAQKEDERQFYFNTFEEYLKKKGDNLVVYQLLFDKFDNCPVFRERALLLACKHGNQYMVYKALNRYVRANDGGGHIPSFAYEEAVAGRHKVIVQYFHERYPGISSRYLYLSENQKWANGLTAYHSAAGANQYILSYFTWWKTSASYSKLDLYLKIARWTREFDSELEYQTVLAKCKEGDFLECWMAQHRMEGLFQIVRYRKMLEKNHPEYLECWMANYRFEAEDGKFWPNGVESLIAPAAKDGNLWATVAFTEGSTEGLETLAHSVVNETIKRGVHHNILFTLLDTRRQYYRSNGQDGSMEMHRRELVAGFLDVACKYGNDYAVVYLLTGESKERSQDKVFETYVNAIESRNKPMVKYLYHWGMPKADRLPEKHKILLSHDSILWLQNEVTGT